MTLDFPSSPTENTIHSHGTATYRYRSGKWAILRGQHEYISEAYSAVPGDIIFADTSVSAYTVTLPATPPDYTQIKITDAEGTFYFNNLTVARNGSTIEGTASDFTLSKTGVETTFVYYNGTWNIFTASMQPYTDPAHSEIIGPGSGLEGTNVSVVINNYDATSYTYSHSVEGGAATRAADTIDWQLPFLAVNAASTYYTITVTTTSLGGNTIASASVLVIPVEFTGDDAIVVTDFSQNSNAINWDI